VVTLLVLCGRLWLGNWRLVCILLGPPRLQSRFHYGVKKGTGEEVRIIISNEYAKTVPQSRERRHKQENGN